MARSATDMMWADAVHALARVDRLHRDFFRPLPGGWEPPVDLLETEGELIILAALPGVRPDEVEIVLHEGALAVVGIRRLPAFARRARVHRMELPHGRFERRVAIPAGSYEMTRHDLTDGLLAVVLRRLG